MNRKQMLNRGGVFWCSIALNIIGLIAITAGIIWKWDAISAKVHSVLKSNNPSEKDLLEFNNKPIDAENRFFDAQSDTTISVLILGNSITLHSVVENLMDAPARGMMASTPNNDYVHQLIKMIADKKKANVDYSVANIAEFERNFTQTQFDIMSKLSNAKNIKPDYLIVQIGENVSEEDIKTDNEFHDAYMALLDKFPQSVKIITIPFWSSKNKQNIITQVALDSDSYLIDLSHLGNGIDRDNFASSEHDYSNPSVGMHPGDYGMENIARTIFTIFNAEVMKEP